MSFKIPTPKIPTEKEMRAIARNWWKHHEGINFADWNDTLRNNSFPYRICKIPKKLITETLKFADGKGNYEWTLKEYGKLIYPALVEMECENSFFIKLISRSPKDSLADRYNHTKPRALSTFPDTLNAILNSMRCFDDLCMLLYLPKHASLIVRPYIDFSPADEWRVYVQDKRIVGVSQYYYDSTFPELTEQAVHSVNRAIRVLMRDVVTPNIKLNDYVVDVVTGNDERKIAILEINPYGLSDPCLFKDYNSFDGSIVWKINGSRHKMRSDRW